MASLSPRPAVAVVIMSLCLAALRGQGTMPPPADPAFNAAVLRGETALKSKNYDAALDAFNTANNLQRSSPVVLYGLARAYHGLSAWKSAVDACTEALKSVGDDKRLEAQLHNQRGLAYMQLAVKPTDKPVRDAEGEFRQVLVLTETMPIAWYNLAVSLLKQSRDPEGVAALQAFVANAGNAPEVANAKLMIENPRRGREPFAPDFGAATMEGVYLTLKELQGKVVLMDFWGTWCGPCVAATPMLVDISKNRAKDARFQMLGISNDKASDVNVLREFIVMHKMTWPEIHDTTNKVVRIYEVTSFPTYIVLDHEGIIRERVTGFGSTTRGKLDEAITKAIRAMPKEK